MKNHFAFAGLLALSVTSGPLQAQTALPKGGTCELPREYLSSDMALAITWTGGSAIVREFGKAHAGRVVGLRKHGSSFKLSVFWEHPVLGESEIIVFGMGDAQYRMANVSYNKSIDGERIVGSIEGFGDATCSLID